MSAMRFLGAQAEQIHDRTLRAATLAILKNPSARRTRATASAGHHLMLR
jgi:hypothetical protein